MGGSGTLIDITHRKHTEEALLKSSQKWEAIIATSTDGIGMASVDGKIQFLSDNIALMCGYTPEEKNQFIGGSFFDFIDPSCHNQLAVNLQKLLSDKEEKKIREYIALKKDKSRFYVELNSTVLLDSNGKPESILYFVRDISERKEAENALMDSEKKFKSIVESQAEGIGLVNKDEIFEFVNAAAAKIFETTIDELTGSPLYDFLNPREIEKIAHQTSRRKYGITNDYELQIVTKAGNIRFIEVSVSPKLDERNNYAGAYGIFRDITDRKLAQEALKEKTLLLSNLLINMQEGILLEDSSRKIVLTNQLFCDMFSIPAPPDALIGADCSESAEQTKSLFKDPEKFLTQIHKVLADKEAILNDQLELADGRYFEQDYIPTYHENAYNGHLWKYRDITERKNSEHKISQQNERLNAIITAMPDLIFVLDQYGNNMEYYSNTPEKLLTPEDKVVGMNIEALFDQETAQYHLQKINECIELKKLVSYEYKVGQGISLAFYEARLVPLGMDNVLAFIRDVSEKKQQENEIKKLYLAIEQSPVSIIVTDLSARMEYVNPAFLSTTGYSSAEVIGNNPRMLKSGKTDKSVYQDLWKTITAGQVWEGEWQDKKKNGELFWEHVSINPIITEDGEITNYLGVKQDITQRKQAEEEIRNLNANLELRIAERTAQLSEINGVLQTEIAERKRASEAMAEALDRLNKIADRVPGMVYQYLLNTDGTSCFPYSSEGIRDIYRVTPDEVVIDASVVFTRIHPDDFEGVVVSIQDSAKDLAIWHHEYRVKFEDGTINWLLGNALPQRLANGAVLWHGFISDITAHKEIESALIASRQSYKMVLENIKEIIFQTDVNGLWIFLNKAWEEVTGFSVEESMGQLFVNFVHPDDRQRNMELFQPLIEREKDYCHHQVRYLTKDGGFRWIEVYARLGLNEHDEIIGTYGTLQDITERKEAEDNLEQLSFRLSLAVQAGGVGVWDYNLVDDILTWDNQMFELYGIKKENFTNVYNAWQAGLHPDDRVRGDHEIQMALSGEKEFDTEFRVVWPDGTIHYIRAMAIVQHDGTGNPVHMVGTNWDITANKKAEEELKSKMALLEAQKNATPDGILVVDQAKEHFLVINKRYLEIFEVPVEIAESGNAPLLLRHVAAMVKNRDKFLEITLMFYDDPYSTNNDEIELVNGMILDRYSAPVMGLDGRLYGRIWSFLDITERKKAEEEIIKARNEAETANLAKSEFLSRMSHELRTPMNSILGFAQLMEMGGGLNPQQNKGLGHIMNSGRHLLNLINEVLEISRIEAGHLAISLEPVLIENIIGEIWDSIQPMAYDRNIKFILLDPPVDQLFVNSDYQRLKQVFLNLFANAIKYNSKGGTVTIKTEILNEFNAEAPYVRISITDTGLGISPEDIPRLFKPFERIGAEKTQTEGTGLGLSVVKRLMDAMGGRIGVESVFGTGSTFWIELPGIENPLSIVHQTMTIEERHSAGDLHRGTILYIEDNSSNVELVEQILISQRPNIRLISNMHGKLAVSLALKLEPDLILLDLNLPDINGDEVIRLLQEEEKTKNIPVVIISADAMALQLKKLLSAGARNYLTKPLDVTAFLLEVDKWIGIQEQNRGGYPK